MNSTSSDSDFAPHADGSRTRPADWYHRVDGPRRGPLLLALLVCLPIIVAQAKIFGTHWYPGGDMAQAELHVRGLWNHPPLVGAAGRIVGADGAQGSHPGPSLWFALWPVYALLGRTSRALVVSVGVIHIVSVSAALWLARRRGGTSLMVGVAGALGLIIRASGVDFATEPWNPWLAVIPFAVFVLLCWTATEGDRWALCAAVVVGSHCVQCHAGYGVVVVSMLAATTVFVIATASASRAHQTSRREVLVGVCAAFLGGIITWALPLLDQFRRTPGNFSALLHQFGSPAEPYISTRSALRIIGNQLNLAGPWVRGREVLSVSVVGLVGLIALWLSAIIVSVRVSQQSLKRLHGLLGVGAASGALSVTRLFGGYFEYTVRWWWVLTGLITATSVSALWQAWTQPRSTRNYDDRDNGNHVNRNGDGDDFGDPVIDRPRTPSRRLASSAGPVALMFTAVVSLGGGVQAADRAKLPGAADSAIVGGLAPRLVAALEDLSDPTVSQQYPPRYLVRWFDPQYLGASAFGLVLELERQGIDVGVDRQFSAAALPHRVLGEDIADGVLYLVIGSRIDEIRRQASAVELAAFDIRRPEQATRSVEVRQLLIDRFAEMGRPELADQLDKQYGLTSLLFSPTPLPEDVSALVIEYLDLGQPAAVFLTAPGVTLTAIPELGSPGS